LFAFFTSAAALGIIFIVENLRRRDLTLVNWCAYVKGLRRL